MPWLHRLACLRDDAVFLVNLYQRWIYKEDKRRRNEFGQVGEKVDETNDDVDIDSSDEEKEGAEKEKDTEPIKVANDSVSGLKRRFKSK